VRHGSCGRGGARGGAIECDSAKILEAPELALDGLAVAVQAVEFDFMHPFVALGRALPAWRVRARGNRKGLAQVTHGRMLVRSGSCVDGPQLARDFSHGGSVALRSCVRPADAAEAAGPDGNRGSRPDQTHGVALPLDPKKVALDPSIDRRCHHASSPSQASRASWRQPFRPPSKWPGSPPGASSGPSRCAPSCWPRRRPPLCAPCWQAA
jgi:hypothetical protein